jgi:Ca2+:H+ antiporter
MKDATRLSVAWITVALFLLFGSRWLAEPIAPGSAALLFAWIFATMVWSAFGAIEASDKLAEILGEPLGSLLLTLTIISLEGMLIAIAMLTSDFGATMGRDALMGANMIMINFAGGLALFLGGLRYGEQTYNFQGTSAYLAMVITSSVIAFILPTYTDAIPRGSVTAVQSAGILIVILAMYATFLPIQIGRHRHFFMEADSPHTLTALPVGTAGVGTAEMALTAERGDIGKLTLLLIAGVLPVLLLAESLTKLLDFASEKLGTPPALGGVFLALIVISPKMISAIKAGYLNEPQRSVNLALGSCAPANGIILPIILVIGIATGKTIIMGLVPAEVIMLALTLVLAALTFSGQRTTVLEGAAHLAVFVMYIVLMFSP